MAVKVGNLFVEISGDASPLEKAFNQAVNSAKTTFSSVENAGQRFILNFEKALNPTRDLAQNLKLLEAAGKSYGDIQAVMSERIKAGVEQATKLGQSIDPVVKKHYDAITAGEKWKFSLEDMGKSITNFATNPLEAMKSGIGSMLEKMGPTAVAMGGIATAVIGAGVALFKYAETQSDMIEGLDNMSAKTGLTIQTLQALEIITENAGLGGMDLGRIIGKLNEQLGKGEGEFIDAIKRLNLEMTDTTTGKPKDVLQFLDEIRAYLLSIPNEANRTSEAQRILGGRLADLIPLLLKSREGLGEQTKALIDQNVVMSRDTIETWKKFDVVLDEANIQISRVKNASSGLVAELGLSIANSSFYKTVVAGLNIVLSEYEQKTKKSSDAINKANDITKAYGEETGKYVKLTKEQIAEQKKAAEETKKLREETDKSLRPMDALSKEIKKQTDLGYDANKIIALHSKEIINAANRQIELGESLSGASSKLYGEALAAQAATSGLDKLNEVTEKALRDGAKLILMKEDSSTATRDNTNALNDLMNAEAGQDAASKRLAADRKEMQDDLQKELEESRKKAEELGNEFAGAFGQLTDNLAANIIEWKGWGDSLMGFVKNIAHSLLSSFLDGLLNPLMNKIQGLGDSLSGWLTGGGSGGGIVGKVLGGLGVGSSGTGGLTGAVGIGSAGLGTAGVAAVPGVGLSGLGASIGAFATNPITLAVAGAAALGYGITKLVDLIQGPDSWEAMSDEISRDFKGVKVSPSICQAFGNAVGITEAEAWKFRQNIKTSPMFLLNVTGPAAEEQGKMDGFMQSLSSIGTSWGNFNFLPGWMKGLQTGDWSGLNDAWKGTGMADANFGKIVQGGADALLIPQSASVSPTVEDSLAKGSNYIPKTGLYQLHQGEAVIPAAGNRSPSINVYIQAPVYGLDDLDKKISQSIKRTYSRNGLQFLGAT